MSDLEYQGKTYHCHEGETVLKAFMRHGVTVPFSCGNGVCHVCMRRCESGGIPTASQKGLRDTLKEKNYFLTCKCVPVSDMKILPPRDADLFNHAVVYKKELLAPDVCRVLLEPATQVYYHAGQFINVRNIDGETRSYSLASVPQEDYFLEIHVKRVLCGTMSNWIFDELSEHDELEFQGPTGNSYYVSGDKSQPLLLIGTGTGISPLIGIVRDALTSGHTGPIYLYHGSRHIQGLYLQNALQELMVRYRNFHPVCCISGDRAPKGIRAGRANEVALAEHTRLKGWRVYLSGQPKMVKDARQAALVAGANSLEIHADPFWDLANYLERDAEAEDASTAGTTERIRCAERRKYPDPDLDLWRGLGEGQLLSKVLIDFYNHVYADPLLAPFFANITKQRLIEKQYNFLCQVLTGKDVYFGKRPRNAHHWMVISDELFDYRADLMKSCLRRAGVQENLVRRFHAIEEMYREDIVKNKPWKKVLFGKEVPVEGFDKIALDDATLCDSCQQEIQAGELVQYHVRLGKVYCGACQQD